MIVIKIHAWHPDRAYGTYAVEQIVDRLRMYTDIKMKRDLEAMARSIRDRTCKEIRLAKAKSIYEAHSMRSILDGLGAETTVEEV